MDTFNPAFRKAEFMTFDIETGNAEMVHVEAKMAKWSAPKNIKDPEKIEAKRVEAEAKAKDKAALLDASPIICITLTSDIGSIAIDGMSADKWALDGWTVINVEGEKALLEELAALLALSTDERTELVGHNVIGFDLPKLRNAYLRHSLTMPSALMPRAGGNQPVYDTMTMFTRYYSMQHRNNPFCSLDSVAESLGIDRHKSIISGADVPRMAEEGLHQEITTYCALDTLVTHKAYLMMTGRLANQAKSGATQ